MCTAVAPRAYTSPARVHLAASVTLWPAWVWRSSGARHCHGARKRGDGRRAVATSAREKSPSAARVELARVADKNTLRAATSQCTTPCAWRCASAAATSRTIMVRSRTVRTWLCDSAPPGQYSVTSATARPSTAAAPSVATTAACTPTCAQTCCSRASSIAPRSSRAVFTAVAIIVDASVSTRSAPRRTSERRVRDNTVGVSVSAPSASVTLSCSGAGCARRRRRRDDCASFLLGAGSSSCSYSSDSYSYS
mmetsp:Transcript_37584/g.92127  ORF Transcript_37584/g.92127 Transcript_37584/m.92127 type:complete len:251 (-) Transcript_37584:66-818(-)